MLHTIPPAKIRTSCRNTATQLNKIHTQAFLRLFILSEGAYLYALGRTAPGYSMEESPLL